MLRRAFILATMVCLPSFAQTKPSKLPFLDVDVEHKQVRVECESIECKAPLEFFCCVTGTNEHEAVLRSKVKPSQLHLALLMLGLEPGQPVHYDEKQKKWIPPHGPPLKISCQWQKDGKPVTFPAEQMMRDVKNKKPMPQARWVFVGSRVTEQGYAADLTGYLVSIVNFELTVIDVPALASSANETLEWESNPDVVPPRGTKVTMILEPAEK